MTVGIVTVVLLGAAPAAAEGIGDCASSIARDPTAFGFERLGDNVSRVAKTAPGAIPLEVEGLRALDCR